ncbi:GntR family transcriptional regulator [Miniimonas arenae]|uniref:GntR family transcriptional regulator n=1 Tax=Miniimonas arenae TaxID=676201 RepID=UPI0028AE0FA1|nr:GntR family transcriptional regulator [Miniimonas arenae]
MVTPVVPLARPGAVGEDGAPSEREESLDGSLSDRLYQTLRRRIILGELAPGSRLPEQRLADELEASRIPLREALSRLATDNLVTASPRRSAVVGSWSASDVHDLLDARLALETSAAGRAARRESGVRDLEVALTRSMTELRAGDELGFAEANVRFHVALVQAAGNPLLDGLMRTISARMTWLFFLTSNRDHDTQCREHAAIVEAVRLGNSRLAEALVFSHIEAGREPTLATLADALRG